MNEIDILFEATLLDDDEAGWESVVALLAQDPEQVLLRALAWTKSRSTNERRRAADVLGQLGDPRASEPIRPRCADALVQMVGAEEEPSVLSSIGTALGHLRDARAVKTMVPFATHPSEDVRLGVVLALSVHEAGVDTLIQLSADPDRDVRNWATFALGSQLEQVDTPALRDALVERLAEPDLEVRGEALLGLAVRKDPRVIEPLRRELASGEITVLAIEAAQRLGDSQFTPALRAALEAAPATAPQHWRNAVEEAIHGLETMEGPLER